MPILTSTGGWRASNGFAIPVEQFLAGGNEFGQLLFRLQFNFQFRSIKVLSVRVSGSVANRRLPGEPLLVTVRGRYAASPKSRSPERTCPTMSPFASHLTCPFRIMFIAS